MRNKLGWIPSECAIFLPDLFQWLVSFQPFEAWIDHLIWILLIWISSPPVFKCFIEFFYTFRSTWSAVISIRFEPGTQCSITAMMKLYAYGTLWNRVECFTTNYSKSMAENRDNNNIGLILCRSRRRRRWRTRTLLLSLIHCTWSNFDSLPEWVSIVCVCFFGSLITARLIFVWKQYMAIMCWG